MNVDYERTSYDSMKSSWLEMYFVFCRDMGLMRKASHREVLAYVEYQCEDIFELSVEILMMRVIKLILSCGLHEDLEKTMRDIISNQISTEGLDNLLQGVPADEVELFKHDLRILKFIP